MDPAHSPTLYLVCGRIAAGKSTLARRLATRPATLLISEDHWTSNLFSGDLKTIDDYARLSARLRTAMTPHIVDILQLGLSVALDFQANTVRVRSWMRALITEANVTHELHFLDGTECDLQAAPSGTECERQAPVPGERRGLRSVFQLLRPTRPEEGFNVIVHAVEP